MASPRLPRNDIPEVIEISDSLDDALEASRVLALEEERRRSQEAQMKEGEEKSGKRKREEEENEDGEKEEGEVTLETQRYPSRQGEDDSTDTVPALLHVGVGGEKEEEEGTEKAENADDAIIPETLPQENEEEEEGGEEDSYVQGDAQRWQFSDNSGEKQMTSPEEPKNAADEINFPETQVASWQEEGEGSEETKEEE
jgi:hypothetical protein